jgi:hypothetical protein
MLLWFFGSQAAMVFDPDWPETMLQLSPGAERAEVVLALRTKLAQLNMHPHGSGPDVQALRAVLKGIAAQMINGPGAPWSDALEAEIAGEPHLPIAALVQSPGAVDGAARAGDAIGEQPAYSADFSQHVLHAVTAQPGAEGLRRALMVAALHGVPAEAVVALLHGQRPRTAGVEDAMAGAVRLPQRGHAEHDALGYAPAIRTDAEHRDSSTTKLWLALAAVMLLSVGGSAWLIYRTSAASAPRPAVPATPSGQNTAPAPPLTPPAPALGEGPAIPVSRVGDGPPNSAVFVRDIESAVKGFDGTSVGLQALRGPVQVFLHWWPVLELPARTSAVESIVEGMFRCTTPEVAGELFAMLVAEPLTDAAKPIASADIWPMTGGAGVLARLARERELPPGVVAAREKIIGKVFGSRRAGPGFAAGVEFAASGMPVRLIGGDTSGLGPAELASRAAAAEEAADKWWEAITRGVGGALTGDEAERQSQLVALAAIERVLVLGPDLLESPVAFRFVARVLSKMRYRPGDPSRARIVAWIGDARISLGDVHAITQVLASRTGASGIDASMVLPPTATPIERENVRVQFAGAWELSSGGPSAGAEADWLNGARSILSLSASATVDIEQATAGALLAQLCRAAAMRARGEVVPASLSSVPAAGLASIATTNAGGTAREISTAQAGDGAWAIKYLVESKGVGARLARFAELAGGGIGPVDAGVVADVALTGGTELRGAAQAAAMRYVNEPEMVNAVLEAFPKAPRSLRNAIFLASMAQGSVVSPASGQWVLHYRRALVERILSITAAQNPLAGMDQIASVFADAYLVMAGEPARDVSPDEAGPLSVRAASTLFNALWEEASRLPSAVNSPVSLAEIKGRRAARLTVAQGVVQTFAAEQVGCVELLSAIVASEKPARIDEIKSIILTMDQDRRSAKSAAVQMRVAQEAMLRLWSIRLGEQL